MSDLFSMLVPLAGGHFPGWPTTETPSAVQFLVVLVAIPVGIGLIITLLTFSGTLARRGRGGEVQLSEPLWIGQATTVRALATSSARAGHQRGSDLIEVKTGGASVYW